MLLFLESSVKPVTKLTRNGKQVNDTKESITSKPGCKYYGEEVKSTIIRQPAACLTFTCEVDYGGISKSRTIKFKCEGNCTHLSLAKFQRSANRRQIGV